MTVKSFWLAGEGEGSALDIDTASVTDLGELRNVLGEHLGVVQPEGLSFHSKDGDLADLKEVEASEASISLKVDGHAVRDVPGPSQLPLVGNYFEVFPDHLGNNERLFKKYGKLFQTTTSGATSYYTNDPQLAEICFTESQWFSKEIIPGHPLYPIKHPAAGVFLGDTADPSWKIVHKFLPPALGPKAVRHYAPTMNNCLTEAYPVLDELEKRGDSWNVYQMMLKLSSGTVGKIMLGKDFGHFTSVDAPLHKLTMAMAELLAINKRIASRGQWYANLPFGDPVKLHNLQQFIRGQIQESITNSKASGTENLPLQDAALKAANVIDYLVRATDTSGAQLPKENLLAAVMVATGAGFTTTSSLLSWCIYGLVTYANTQARLLQEMADLGMQGGSVSAERIDEMPELDKFVKEMQRRHNPSYQPGRTAQRDMILPGGYRLKKGSVVIVALHHIHMNAAVWDNPDRFDMDRWDTKQVKERHKTAYVPFAYGQRSCIGFNFALLEVKIFVCRLVWRYHWEKEGEAEVEIDPFFQLIRPVNLYVRTQKRDAWPSVSERVR